MNKPSTRRMPTLPCHNITLLLFGPLAWAPHVCYCQPQLPKRLSEICSLPHGCRPISGSKLIKLLVWYLPHHSLEFMVSTPKPTNRCCKLNTGGGGCPGSCEHEAVFPWASHRGVVGGARKVLQKSPLKGPWTHTRPSPYTSIAALSKQIQAAICLPVIILSSRKSLLWSSGSDTPGTWPSAVLGQTVSSHWVWAWHSISVHMSYVGTLLAAWSGLCTLQCTKTAVNHTQDGGIFLHHT